jgi:hypothetical protein
MGLGDLRRRYMDGLLSGLQGTGGGLPMSDACWL